MVNLHSMYTKENFVTLLAKLHGPGNSDILDTRNMAVASVVKVIHEGCSFFVKTAINRGWDCGRIPAHQWVIITGAGHWHRVRCIFMTMMTAEFRGTPYP